MQKVKRHIQPPLGAISKPIIPEPRSYKLDNQIPVFCIQTEASEAIKFEIIIKAGSAQSNKRLVSKFTAGIIKEGSKNFSSEQIAETFDFYGSYLDVSANKDAIHIKLLALKKYLDKLLPLLSEILWKPTFPEDELNIYKSNSKQQFIINTQKVSIEAKRHFFPLIYGENHPYGRLVQKEDFDRIQRDDLIGFYKNHYVPENCKIIVTGQLNDKLSKTINEYFGKQQGAKIKTMQSDFQVKTNIKHKLLSKKGALQSSIRIGKALFPKNHPDYLRLKVFNTIFGGYFGSRLMTNIREDKGYTYGIGSGLVSLYHSGYFFISSQVGADVTQAALDEIYAELDKMQQHKVPEQELNLVKNYLLGEFLRQMDGILSQAEIYRSILEFDLSTQYLKNYFDIIKNISADEILQLAQTYFDKNTLTELVVGNK